MIVRSMQGWTRAVVGASACGGVEYSNEIAILIATILLLDKIKSNFESVGGG